MMKSLARFIREEDGLTMVEYAIAGALVTATAVLAFTTLGGNIGTQITNLATIVGTA